MSELRTPVPLVTLIGMTVIAGAAAITYGAILLFRRLRGPHSADGGRPSALDALPVAVYAGGSRPPESCAICLGDYEEGEALRVLPKCKHGFHRKCLDKWLMRSSTCPICRTIVTELKIDTTSAGGDSGIVSDFAFDCPAPLTSVVIRSVL